MLNKFKTIVEYLTVLILCARKGVNPKRAFNNGWIKKYPQIGWNSIKLDILNWLAKFKDLLTVNSI